MSRKSVTIAWAVACLSILSIGCFREDIAPEARSAANKGRRIAAAVANDRICVLQYVSHPLLDAVYGGFRSELARRGYDVSKLAFQNANGDATTASLLADKACKDQFGLIFVLATPMAQSTKSACPPNRPILFGAITDPTSAQLVHSMEYPGGNLTGTSDQWPYQLQMELIAKVWGPGTKVGVPFNPSEANTKYAMEQTRKFAKASGLSLVEVPINNVAEASQAVDALSGKVAVIYIPSDNTAVAAAPGIIAAADREHRPVIAGDPGTFKAGAIVGLGVDYASLGIINARQALDILRGARASTMPVEVSNKPELYLNREKATQFGISTPAIEKWYASRQASVR